MTKPGADPCAQACWDCRDTCQTVFFTDCLAIGVPHVEAEHIRVMADCIQICQITADFIRRKSVNHATLCRSCAEVCDACARSCETIASSDMQACAQACRHCAEECRRMAA